MKKQETGVLKEQGLTTIQTTQNQIFLMVLKQNMRGISLLLLDIVTVDFLCLDLIKETIMI